MLAALLLFAAMPPQAAPAPLQLNPMAATVVRCAAVTSAMGKGVNPATLSARAGYFIIAAAHADPGGKLLMTRAGEISNHLGEYLVEERDRPAVSASCQREYPMAYRVTINGTLPSDAFVRDAMCLGAAGVQYGAAMSYAKNSGDTSFATRYKPLIDRIAVRLTDKMVRDHGYKTDLEYQRFVGEQLYAALSLGNVETVADACLRVTG